MFELPWLVWSWVPRVCVTVCAVVSIRLYLGVFIDPLPSISLGRTIPVDCYLCKGLKPPTIKIRTFWWTCFMFRFLEISWHMTVFVEGNQTAGWMGAIPHDFGQVLNRVLLLPPLQGVKPSIDFQKLAEVGTMKWSSFAWVSVCEKSFALIFWVSKWFWRGPKRGGVLFHDHDVSCLSLQRCKVSMNVFIFQASDFWQQTIDDTFIGFCLSWFKTCQTSDPRISWSCVVIPVFTSLPYGRFCTELLNELNWEKKNHPRNHVTSSWEAFGLDIILAKEPPRSHDISTPNFTFGTDSFETIKEKHLKLKINKKHPEVVPNHNHFPIHLLE